MIAAVLVLACAACGAGAPPSAEGQSTGAVGQRSSVDEAASNAAGSHSSAADEGDAAVPASPVPPPPPPVPPPFPACPSPPSDGADAGAAPVLTGIVGYSTTAEFEALAVGQWLRATGDAQLANEDVGIELTSDHAIYALRRAAGGALERRSPDDAGGGQSWTISFADLCSGPALVFQSAGMPAGSTYTIGAPTFTDGGFTMSLTYAPWAATYTRNATK